MGGLPRYAVDDARTTLLFSTVLTSSKLGLKKRTSRHHPKNKKHVVQLGGWLIEYIDVLSRSSWYVVWNNVGVNMLTLALSMPFKNDWARVVPCVSGCFCGKLPQIGAMNMLRQRVQWIYKYIRLLATPKKLLACDHDIVDIQNVIDICIYKYLQNIYHIYIYTARTQTFCFCRFYFKSLALRIKGSLIIKAFQFNPTHEFFQVCWDLWKSCKTET